MTDTPMIDMPIFNTKLLQHAWAAQMRYARALTIDAFASPITDDFHDALTGALRLAATLEDYRFDSDWEGFRNLLKMPEPTEDEPIPFAPIHENYSVDGICPFLQNLHDILNHIDELS